MPDGAQEQVVPDEPSEPDPLSHLPLIICLPQELHKYVDDNVILEKLNMDNFSIYGRFVQTKGAVWTKNLSMKIVHQVVAQGMKVNTSKTKVLLISELRSYALDAFFTDNEGGQVKAKKSLKILGLHFSSSDSGMAAQVAGIQGKFAARIWALRHLGWMGMDQKDLAAVYKSTLLPMHDCSSSVFNSSFTLDQSGQPERLQVMDFKAIYGYDHSYRALLSLSGLFPLKARRDERGDKFAARCMPNPRFAGWFPRPARNTGWPMEYQETRARTKRLFNCKS